MKKKYLFAILLVSVGMVLSSCSLIGRSLYNSYKNSQQSSDSSKDNDFSIPDDFEDEDEDESDSSSEYSFSLRDTKRIGSAEHGYVDVPKEWVKFTDLDGDGSALQYSDLSGQNIVTLNSYTKETSNIEEGEEFSAKTIAERIYGHEEEQEEVTDLWGEKTTVVGHETYKINVTFESDKILVCWLFKVDEKVYFVSFEGDEQFLPAFTQYIEKDWSLTENANRKSDI